MMNFAQRSLRGRLILLSSGILLIALIAVWFGLSALFEKHVEHRVNAELTNHLNQLIVSIKEPNPGKFKIIKPLSDPRFRQPFSGLYWQVSSNDAVILKSRSLWDFDIDVTPILNTTIGLQEYSIKGPDKSDLFSVGQNVILKTTAGEQLFLMTVGLDHQEISKAVDKFSYDLALTLIALALVLFLAVLIQVSVGLLPLLQLQREIKQLQDGERQKLTEVYPDEIKPVIDEINTFISAQEIAAARGRARAGDLAHGFKTPLSVLTAVARRLEKAGEREATNILRHQINTMQQHVNSELAKAKLQSIQPRKSQQINIAIELNKLITTFNHLKDDQLKHWNLQVPKEIFAQIDASDFNEVCGNLLENAEKWCLKEILITARTSGQKGVIIEIEDDGPGVPTDQMDQILRRGKRLDETTKGTGLGLAIANDIMNAYGFKLELYRAKIGGLGIRLFMTGIQKLG